MWATLNSSWSGDTAPHPTDFGWLGDAPRSLRAPQGGDAVPHPAAHHGRGSSPEVRCRSGEAGQLLPGPQALTLPCRAGTATPGQALRGPSYQRSRLGLEPQPRQLETLPHKRAQTFCPRLVGAGGPGGQQLFLGRLCSTL